MIGDPEDRQSCGACGKPWTHHNGIAATCAKAELYRRRAEKAEADARALREELRRIAGLAEQARRYGITEAVAAKGDTMSP